MLELRFRGSSLSESNFSARLRRSLTPLGAKVKKLIVAGASVLALLSLINNAHASSIKDADAGFCQKVGAVIAGVGATVAGASSAASAVGFAAVPHAAGGFIISSVGAGGTGYVAGTLGTAMAGALGLVSSPVVIALGAGVMIGAGGTATACWLVD
jgi:hypothetical protein